MPPIIPRFRFSSCLTGRFPLDVKSVSQLFILDKKKWRLVPMWHKIAENAINRLFQQCTLKNLKPAVVKELTQWTQIRMSWELTSNFWIQPCHRGCFQGRMWALGSKNKGQVQHHQSGLPVAYDCWEETVDEYNIINPCGSKYDLPKSSRSWVQMQEKHIERKLKTPLPKAESVSMDKDYQILNAMINVLSNESSFKSWENCPSCQQLSSVSLLLFM